MKLTKLFAYIVGIIGILLPCMAIAWVIGRQTGLWEYMFVAAFTLLVMLIIHEYIIGVLYKKIILIISKEIKVMEEKEILLTGEDTRGEGNNRGNSHNETSPMDTMAQEPPRSQ